MAGTLFLSENKSNGISKFCRNGGGRSVFEAKVLDGDAVIDRASFTRSNHSIKKTREVKTFYQLRATVTTVP